MESKRIALIASIAVIALIAVGAGYAYTAITTSTDNYIDVDYFEVIPYDGDNPVYTTQSTDTNIPDLKYDTKKSGSSTITWRLDGDTSSQSITRIDKIQLLNYNTGEAKTWGGLDVTISGGTATALLGSGGEYSDNAITVTLKIGQNELASSTMTKSADSLTVHFDIAAVGSITANALTIPANGGHIDCGIEITIADDTTADNETWHEVNLSGKKYDLTFKATATSSS